jgi:hypothetical protein
MATAPDEISGFQRAMLTAVILLRSPYRGNAASDFGSDGGPCAGVLKVFGGKLARSGEALPFSASGRMWLTLIAVRTLTRGDRSCCE